MSRSRKKTNRQQSFDKDIRTDKQRGFRRHIKLKLQEGDYEELPEAPNRITNDDVESKSVDKPIVDWDRERRVIKD